MKSFSLRALSGVLGALLTSCGDPYFWSSDLSGTHWFSTTITPDQTARGVISSTFILHFGQASARSDSPRQESGPFKATLIQVYSLTAGSMTACTEVTRFKDATWYANPNPMVTMPVVTGTLSLTGETSMTSRDGCVTRGVDSYNIPGLYLANDGVADYGTDDNGYMLQLSGNSLIPFGGAGVTWNFYGFVD